MENLSNQKTSMRYHFRSQNEKYQLHGPSILFDHNNFPQKMECWYKGWRIACVKSFAFHNQQTTGKKELVRYEGFITKRGGKRKNELKRWFILNDFSLKYYKDDTTKSFLGQIDLSLIKKIESNSQKLELYLKIPSRQYELLFDNLDSLRKWEASIKSILSLRRQVIMMLPLIKKITKNKQPNLVLAQSLPRGEFDLKMVSFFRDPEGLGLFFRFLKEPEMKSLLLLLVKNLNYNFKDSGELRYFSDLKYRNDLKKISNDVLILNIMKTLSQNSLQINSQILFEWINVVADTNKSWKIKEMISYDQRVEQTLKLKSQQEKIIEKKLLLSKLKTAYNETVNFQTPKKSNPNELQSRTQVLFELQRQSQTETQTQLESQLKKINHQNEKVNKRLKETKKQYLIIKNKFKKINQKIPIEIPKSISKQEVLKEIVEKIIELKTNLFQKKQVLKYEIDYNLYLQTQQSLIRKLLDQHTQEIEKNKILLEKLEKLPLEKDQINKKIIKLENNNLNSDPIEKLEEEKILSKEILPTLKVQIKEITTLNDNLDSIITFLNQSLLLKEQYEKEIEYFQVNIKENEINYQKKLKKNYKKSSKMGFDWLEGELKNLENTLSVRKNSLQNEMNVLQSSGGFPITNLQLNTNGDDNDQIIMKMKQQKRQQQMKITELNLELSNLKQNKNLQNNNFDQKSQLQKKNLFLDNLIKNVKEIKKPQEKSFYSDLILHSLSEIKN
ncbi:tandem ph domain containing protein [Anaeramoeba flamelloides]|uniref:Tandem ph domain containing protein n=1 Tax=Anaeramoeba flamelloides TaxID=1746091 RepID=A0ABQ8YN25_9EUKA|nr:tandem ph domain containing protein [Anaeramoeba flamelloides]